MTSLDVYIDVSDSMRRSEIQRTIVDWFRQRVSMTQRNIGFDTGFNAILENINAKIVVLVHIPRLRLYFFFDNKKEFRSMRLKFDAGLLKQYVDLMFK